MSGPSAIALRPSQATPPAPLLSSARLLLRKCSCGGSAGVSGECAECGKRRLSRRRAAGLADTAQVPPAVYDVLRAPGQSLDGATRGFMESRFGHDFSRVRIHTNMQSAGSADAVNALAYTVGNDIVFAARQYAPATASGRELLAHELAHVVQQEGAAAGVGPLRIAETNGPEEARADRAAQAALAGGASPPVHQALGPSAQPMLSRRVVASRVHCAGGSDGAPADPVADLTAIVDRAEGLARGASGLLTFTAALMTTDVRAEGSSVETAFGDRFGLPLEVKGGFLNRMSGTVRPSFEIAWAEEMELMARRYELIADMLGRGFVHYLCMSTTRTFGGCTITDCSSDAWACTGVNAIFLCPGFWAGDPGTGSTLLIHETAHMMWESVGHGARGSGGNFRHAECYASFVADLFNLAPGGPECPVT